MRSDERPEAAVSVRHLLTLGLWAIALVLFLRFMEPLKVFVLGILAAGAMAAALSPLMRLIHANRWLRAAVVGLLPIAATVGLVVLLSYLLSDAIGKQMQQWPEIQQQLDAGLKTWSGRFGLEEPLTANSLLKQLGALFMGGGGEGPGTMIGVTIVYVVVQSLEAYALTPYVMKRAAAMPPWVTLFTVVLWGQVFGLSGLLLAIPINLVIWAFVDQLILQPRQQARDVQRPGNALATPSGDGPTPQ